MITFDVLPQSQREERSSFIVFSHIAWLRTPYASSYKQLGNKWTPVIVQGPQQREDRRGETSTWWPAIDIAQGSAECTRELKALALRPSGAAHAPARGNHARLKRKQGDVEE